MKLIAPLLLSLVTAPSFAHSDHDDETRQPPLNQEAPKDAKKPAAKPKHKHSHAPAIEQDKGKTETPADPAAVEPKK